MYRVTVTMNQRELLKFLEANGRIEATIEVMADATEAGSNTLTSADTSHAIYTPQRGQRKKRGSKVADAIMGSLENGAGSVTALKEALSQAGMSPSSLTTGIAILQKAGTIKRGSDGDYYLTIAKEAAE